MEFKKCQVGQSTYGDLTEDDARSGISDYQGMI
jgi:hypothetical protein